MNSRACNALAVVTAASHSTGFEIARQFVLHGFDVLIADADERIDDTASRLLSLGRRVEPVRVDLAAPGGVEQLWDVVQRQPRQVDALAINVCATNFGASLLNTELDDALRAIRSNVTGTVHFARRLGPLMAERHADACCSLFQGQGLQVHRKVRSSAP